MAPRTFVRQLVGLSCSVRTAFACSVVFGGDCLLCADPARVQSLTLTAGGITIPIQTGDSHYGPISETISEFQASWSTSEVSGNTDVTWEIPTGNDSPDSGKFRLGVSTARMARLEFSTAPDYENAKSAAENHKFKVALRATAGAETIAIDYIVDGTDRNRLRRAASGSNNKM